MLENLISYTVFLPCQCSVNSIHIATMKVFPFFISNNTSNKLSGSSTNFLTLSHYLHLPLFIILLKGCNFISIQFSIPLSFHPSIACMGNTYIWGLFVNDVYRKLGFFRPTSRQWEGSHADERKQQQIATTSTILLRIAHFHRN